MRDDILDVHLAWNLTRPCVFHEQSLRVDGDLDWTDHYVDPACGFGPAWDETDCPDCAYDVEVDVRVLPSYGSIIPRGEYAPIDPPEPPECEILRVRFAGSDARFPWDLSEEEQHEIERAALEEEW